MIVRNSPNKFRLTTWTLTSCIGAFQFGYSQCVLSAFLDLLTVQLAWGESANLLVAVVTTMVPLGATFGSLFGSQFAEFGRRRAFLSFNLLLIVGCGIQLIGTTLALCVGRFLYGFCAGIYSVLVPLFIFEIAPEKQRGSLGALNELLIVFGVFVGYLVGFGVPTPGSPEEASSDYWRFAFSLPIALAVLHTLLLILVFKLDSLEFLRKTGQLHEEQQVISFLYGDSNTTVSTESLLSKSAEHEDKEPDDERFIALDPFGQT